MTAVAGKKIVRAGAAGAADNRRGVVDAAPGRQHDGIGAGPAAAALAALTASAAGDHPGPGVADGHLASDVQPLAATAAGDDAAAVAAGTAGATIPASNRAAVADGAAGIEQNAVIAVAAGTGLLPEGY